EWHGDAEGCAIDEDLGRRELKYPDKLQRLHDAKRDGSHEGRDSEREPEVADSHWRAPLAPSRSSRSVPDRTTYDDRHRNRRTWNRQLLNAPRIARLLDVSDDRPELLCAVRPQR